MKTLNIVFDPPAIPPANGYKVSWRKAGDPGYTLVNPNPTSSPVQIPNLDESFSYEGTIEAVCNNGINSTSVQFSVGALAVLGRFDYMVIRYRNNNGGTDLDTFTGFTENALPFDINYATNTGWVGFSGEAGAGLANNYLKWGGDNTSSGGVESVLIDFKRLIQDYPQLGSTIKLRLHGWFFSQRTSGNIHLELATWIGGTAPVLNGFDFVKTDGTVVDNILLDQNVNCVKAPGSSVDVKCSQRLAEVIYNKINKTALLVPTDGGCDCAGSSGTELPE